MSLPDNLSPAVTSLAPWLAGRTPELAVVLGSGLAAVCDQLQQSVSIPYQEIHGFPPSGVSGHAGLLHCGLLEGRQVLVFQGRYHVYEGYSAWQVSAQVRLARELGCRRILLTNAVGGIADHLQIGDFMLVRDHINLTGQSPLIGRPEREFVDLSSLYRGDLYAPLKTALQDQAISLHQGVLAWMIGPNYETPAEIRALKILGADAVGMSCVPEAIVASLCGMECLTLSFVSNRAAGCDSTRLDHQDVLFRGTHAATNLGHILRRLLPLLN